MVGILNLTPDSFSDGGEFSNLDRAEQHFEAMLAAGADMIDIGRVDASRTSSNHCSGEIDRVIPFIQRIRCGVMR